MQSELKDIISKVKKGDQNAFRLLVERHQQYAFNLAFRIVYNDEEARDIVQESFIKIWQKIGDFNLKLKFTTWMYKIVTNTAIDKIRSARKNIHIKIDDVSEKLEVMRESGLELQMDNRELGQIIRLIADDLPEMQRLTFILRDLEGLASIEVQNILNMKETNVKSNLYHARKMIREKLNKILNYERSSK